MTFRIWRTTISKLMLLSGLFVPFATAWGQSDFDFDFEDAAVKESESEKILFPFVFYHETFELTLGGAFAWTKFPHPQSAITGGFAVGSNGSVAGTVMALDVKLPFGQRWFMDGFVAGGTYDDLTVYADGNPNFPNENAGDNDSHKDNHLSSEGDDLYILNRYRYILPMGDGKAEPLPQYEIEDGLLIGGESGGSDWNPFRSGRTHIEVEPFYRRQVFDNALGEEGTPATNGVELSITVDNRDYRANPSKGYYTRFTYKRDFGWFDTDNEWQVVDGSFSKYFDLGSSRIFRQQILALNFWTSDTPSWKDSSLDNGVLTYDRPPFFAGATLGGIFRMRAYPAARFNDRAAIYYGAEYRVIPKWNPFDYIKYFEKYDIPWIQVALFGEVGRVAPNWSYSTLHENMKWDAGIGLRVFAQGLVFRLDTAVSEEGGGVAMMVAQPF